MNRKYRVDALPTAYLDFLIAQLEGVKDSSSDRTYDQSGFDLDEGKGLYCKTTDSGRVFYFQPTADWRQGGPLLEKHRISVSRTGDGWRASQDGMGVAYGPTLLTAAMRTLVIVTYGEEVELDE